MSRKLFAFLLSELKTVRIICKKCQTAAEMSIKQLGNKPTVKCTSCNEQLIEYDAGGQHALTQLARAAEILQLEGYGSIKFPFTVEFVLPDDGESADTEKK